MRAVAIPYDDIVDGILRPAIRPYIGVVADVGNLVPLLEACLDSYFSAVPTNSPMGPREILRGYGIPTDVCTSVIASVVEGVGCTVQTALTVVYPGRRYIHRVFEDQYILVEEYDSDEFHS